MTWSAGNTAMTPVVERAPTSAARKWKELPTNTRSYLKAIAELTGAKLAIASVGPGREQTILL